MTRTLFALTCRQLLGRRRTVVLATLALIVPIVIALLARSSESDSSTAELAIELAGALIMTGLLPVVALVFGTASLGAEIEDGTAVFLLSTPIERWRILAVKVGVAAAATVAFVVPPVMAMVWIIHMSPTDDGLMFGLGLSAAVASVLYSMVFVALSAWTGRALIVGLIYVFVWEGLVTNLFSSLRWVSIRAYAVGWSDAVITIEDADIYDPGLSAGAAIVVSIAFDVLVLVAGTRALSGFEIGEQA